LVARDGHPKWATDPRQDSNIVYFSGKTHIAYQSSEGVGCKEAEPGPSGTGGYIKVVTYDHATLQWLGPFTVSDKPVYDEHGYPVLAVDSKGYLHIAYDGHQIPLKYKRSVAPNDASAWTAAENVGERATYPHLLLGLDDTLYLFYRERGTSYDRWVENMSTRTAGGSWSGPTTLIDAEWKPNDPANDFTVYTQSVHLGRDNSMYMTWSWLERASETYYDVGFAKSSDSGRTWTFANGAAYALPIRRNGNFEKLWTGVYQSSGTGLAADIDGRVLVLLFQHTADWNNAKIQLKLWDANSWSSSVIATGLLYAKITIDSSGVARGVAMVEASARIKYLEARAPYNTWKFTSIDSPSQSFYPTTVARADGITFEASWHYRVSSDHSELYFCCR